MQKETNQLQKPTLYWTIVHSVANVEIIDASILSMAYFSLKFRILFDRQLVYQILYCFILI